LTNLFGIENGAQIVLQARPESGPDWQVAFTFSKLSPLSPAVMESYTIEYPPGNVVFSDHARLAVDSGINLMTLGPAGRYDYDDDELDDAVLLKGRVTLEVEKMEIQGANLFVRP